MEEAIEAGPRHRHRVGESFLGLRVALKSAIYEVRIHGKRLTSRRSRIRISTPILAAKAPVARRRSGIPGGWTRLLGEPPHLGQLR